jgi:transforming growth factor-beta-induced protein
MRSKTLSTMFALLLGLGLVAAACSSDDESAQEANSETTSTTMASEGTETTMASTETIVDIAAGNPDFSTLVELVTAAGLGETLSGEGPFTVFAPTNSAFAALDPATVEALKADPQGALTEVLKLHVISGKVDAAAATAAAGTCVETLGGKVKVEKSGDSLTIGGAPIVSTDIMASNGVIHVIDGVITAPSEGC